MEDQDVPEPRRRASSRAITTMITATSPTMAQVGILAASFGSEAAAAGAVAVGLG